MRIIQHFNNQKFSFRATIRNITLKGRVGIESLEENGMRSTNHDINLHFESLDHKTNPNGLKNYHENTTELGNSFDNNYYCEFQ